jgi:hypothetical protein
MADETETPEVATRTYTEDEVRQLIEAGSLANSIMDEEVELTGLQSQVADNSFEFFFNNGVKLVVPASGIVRGEIDKT